MSTDQEFHNRFVNRIIGSCAAIAVVFFGILWVASGGVNTLPNAALRDGDWGCKTGESPGALGGPGLTVEDDEVVDAWDFDVSTGTQTSIPFSNVKKVSAVKLTLDSVWLTGKPSNFVCVFD